ncbi:hypothetical protein SASPL_116526 [Salvia splendens]|uniref:Uncharacterized protein n=1 Tax=Salvia splendens TaxID=180675 RepID=A0A8X8ZWT8_SALSN|nr:uncharacterized protein At2g39795, mitochondrial-like [Salvia splendens]KAG6420012.1 hypothetical protein SASPL_116526 [Salvia splendens]
MLRLVSTSAVASHFLSTVAGRSKLIGAINSEIEAIELDIMKRRAVPDDLPFAIEDDDKYCHVMLTRELGPEKIEVTVNPAHDDGDGDPPCVRINVSISKEDKGTLDVGANVSSDEILVDKIAFSEANSYIPSLRLKLEGELQDAMSNFVKVRGIEISSVGFLYNYMLEKRNRWPTIWVPPTKPETDDLKNLLQFVEDW